MSELNIVEKNEFLNALIEEVDMMMFREPKCTYEYIYNDTLNAVMENMKTFFDEGKDSDERIIEIKSDEDDE